MSFSQTYPQVPEEVFLRESLGENGDSTPTLHGKVDVLQTSSNAIESDIATLQTRVGTPVSGTVSSNVEGVQSYLSDTVVGSYLGDASIGLAKIVDEINANEVKIDAVNTKLGTPSGVSVSADIAAIKAQTAEIETDTQDIQSKIGATTTGTLTADIAAVQATVEGLQNDTTFSAYVPDQLERPKSGDPAIDYIILVDHKNSSGAMENFDSAPVVALANMTGTNRSTYLYNAAGTQTQTMDADATGQYSLRIRISATTDIENLVATITGIENTVTRVKRIPCRVDESFSDHFNTADRTTINDTKTNTETILTRIGTPSSGTVSSHVEAAETISQETEDKVDIVDGVVDNILLDTSAIKGTGFGAGDSLKEISDKIDVLSGGAQPGVATKVSGLLAQGESEEIELSSTEGFFPKNAEIFQVTVKPATQTSSNFEVTIYEKSGQTGTNYIFRKWIKAKATVAPNGLFATAYGDIFLNQDTTPTNKMYVRVSNVTDSGSSAFTVTVRYKTLGAIAVS